MNKTTSDMLSHMAHRILRMPPDQLRDLARALVNTPPDEDSRLICTLLYSALGREIGRESCRERG